MQRISVLSVVSLLALAACQDNPTRKSALTEPPSVPSLNVTGADESSARPSICVAYAQELEKHKAALAQDPANQIAAEGVPAYEARIAASCQ